MGRGGTAGSRVAGTRKSVVVIAVEGNQPKGVGRVRMRYVPDASGASLVPLEGDAIAPGQSETFRCVAVLTRHAHPGGIPSQE